MALLSSLPTELLVRIFCMLDSKDLKTTRLVSKYYSAVVEPFIFSEVAFDLDFGGISSLLGISESPTLRQYVRTIRLHRRSGPKDFGAYENWRGLNIYEFVVPERLSTLVSEYAVDDHGHGQNNNYDDDDTSRVVCEVETPAEGLMPREEWEASSDTTRRQFYKEYERERIALRRHIGRLSVFVRSQILGERFEDSSGSANNINNNSNNDDDHLVQKFLEAFEQALKRLPRLSRFSHEPTHLNESWGTRWKRIRFNAWGVLVWHDVDEEMHIDALQLFLSLRSLALTKDAGRGVLHATHMYTGGNAFWRPRDLMMLLDRWDRDGERVWESEDEWIHDNVGYKELSNNETEDLTRQLVSIEHGFFSELNDLCWDIRYETSHHIDIDSDLGGVGRSLSQILHRGRRLKRICITFSDQTTLQDLSDAPYWPHNLNVADASSLWLSSEPDTYQRSRTASAAWLCPPRSACYSFPYLQTVELSVVTVEHDLWAFLVELPALRHLALKHVALLPTGGRWESLLGKCNEHLHLHTIRLVMLEDAISTPDLEQIIPRAILRPRDDIWRDCPEDAHCYESHEAAVLDYAVGRTTSLPSLFPAILQHEHAQ